jgi:hypothetical protein
VVAVLQSLRVLSAALAAVAHPTQAPMALAPLAELVALGPLDSS